MFKIFHTNQTYLCLHPMRLVPLNMLKPFSKTIFHWLFQGGASFEDPFCVTCKASSTHRNHVSVGVVIGGIVIVRVVILLVSGR